jgi:hypothetical protein
MERQIRPASEQVKAEKFQLVAVDIFGGCLPRVRAGEEYLSKFAGSPRSDYF